MSNATELEKLKAALQPAADEAASKVKLRYTDSWGDYWEGVDEAYSEVIQKLDAAIAAEKQRVCANCVNSYKEQYIEDEDGDAHPGIMPNDACPMWHGGELNPQGYCHVFWPREEAGDGKAH